MRDNYDSDPDEVSSKLRRVRARDAQLWGRKVATSEVTPTMIVHTEESRCICDACDGTRSQPPLPAALSARTIVNQNKLLASMSGDDPSPGRPYGQRRETYRINAPRSIPPMSDRALLFALRLLR